MKKRVILPLMLAIMHILPVRAEQSIPAVSKKPHAMMQKLNVLSGKWLARTDMTNDSGKTWQQGKEKQVMLTFRQRGLLLEELPLDIQNGDFHMQTYISYDQYRQVFRKAAIDDVWGIMDLYQGNIVDGNLILDNLTSKTFFPIGPDTWRGFKLTVELKAEKRWLYVDKTDDQGKTWQPAFRVEYIKVAE